MFKSRGQLLIVALLAVAGVDVAWMCVARRPGAATRNSFQRATGGVGLGAAVSPSWSFFAIDPRTESCCENEMWPIPGITCYSPHHGATVVDLPPLHRLRNMREHYITPKSGGP